MGINRASRGTKVLAVYFTVLLVGVSILGVANAQSIRLTGEKESISGKISSLFGFNRDAGGDTRVTGRSLRHKTVESLNETLDGNADYGELDGDRRDLTGWRCSWSK
jgi:hypothetical protein